MKPKSSMLVHCLWIMLIFTGSFSCGTHDSRPSEFIDAREAQVSFTGINAYTPGDGTYLTQFYFIIPYETSPDIKIRKVLYSPTFIENMDEGILYDLGDDGSEINFSLCLEFSSRSRIDFTFTLVSTDGLKSNVTTARINRPLGAN